jgi:glycogen synthase
MNTDSSTVKHILMTADTVGGVWNYSLELAKALGEHGVEISLATMGARISPQQRSEAAKIDNLRIYESNFKLEWMPEPWDDLEKAGDWLLDLESVLQPDVVHLNGYCHGMLPWKSPKVVVCHSCVLSWWEAVRSEPAPMDWIRYEDEVAQGFQGADCVVAPTQAMLDCATKHYGQPKRGKVIYNARDPKNFNVGEKERFIFAVGRLWDEAKNISLLDAVAPRLRWPVYAAGEKAHPTGSASEQVHIKGLGKLSSEELSTWYAKAPIYCLPARYEPFGLSALEAALSGCALVLGDIASLREVWEDCAIFVRPDDAEGLESVLQRLMDNDRDREKLARKARERALTYAPQHMACDYLDLYEGLVEAAAEAKTRRPQVDLR